MAVKASLDPDGLSEVVEVEERSGGAELRVRRIQSEERVESGTAALDAQDLAALWATVRAGSLQTASAPETDVQVRDAKSYLLLLEWPDPQSGRARVHSLHWTNPKEQPAALTRLFDEVGALARTRVSKVRLKYFRP
ncbi:MAG: hypothetical protein DYH12_22305 [Sorangiineae bacterium PRO1]|nr:hypothetical protein [Sorangiineae bacterium PRO1]